MTLVSQLQSIDSARLDFQLAWHIIGCNYSAAASVDMYAFVVRDRGHHMKNTVSERYNCWLFVMIMGRFSEKGLDCAECRYCDASM
jgi:hypothetical protein